jgi:hypothetical protein
MESHPDELAAGSLDIYLDNERGRHSNNKKLCIFSVTSFLPFDQNTGNILE